MKGSFGGYELWQKIDDTLGSNTTEYMIWDYRLDKPYWYDTYTEAKEVFKSLIEASNYDASNTQKEDLLT